MGRFFRAFLVLWTGSLWASALWVVPTLFYLQNDRHLAGILAGRLFSIETYVGVAVAIVAMLRPGRGRFWWGYLAAALLAVNEWALRRVMAAAHAHGVAGGLTFGAWHGVAAFLYVGACLALLLLIWNEDLR
jgi:hypothetical protein